jgi:ribosome-associated protein
MMDEPNADRPSKTQRKRAMHELQSLGERLVQLNAEQLASLDLPEQLRDAVDEARRIKAHEARRRQMQYIGRLMRNLDAGAIRGQLAVWDGHSRSHAALEHEIAAWRERLLEDEAALADLTARHPAIDTQRLRTLLRHARADRDAGRPARHYRELFRELRHALQPAPQAGKER